MSTQTAPPPSAAHDLETQLETAREKTSAAEVALGEGVLDGKATDQLQKTYDDAFAKEQQIATAIGVAKRREDEARETAAEEADRDERIVMYRSVIEWLPRVEAYCRARVALNTAEAELTNNDPHPTIAARKRNFIQRRDPRVHDLDHPLLIALPKPPTLHQQNRTVVFPDPAAYPPDRIEELTARARDLAEAEERGESIAVTATQLEQQQRARRQELRKGGRR